ncbi:MAG: heparinase II/III family protein [Clostridia bacterium]|nr:heparinase II/III family protein [Clostridia bacterium]
MRLFADFTCRGKLITNQCFLAQLSKKAQDEIVGIGTEEKAEFVRKADQALSTEIPVLKASEYMQFYYTGNRTEFQKPYYLRRNMLMDLVLGELIERKSRYTEKITDLSWLMLEESTWVIPAHNRSGMPLLYDRYETSYVDLFSATTAGVLTLVYAFLKEEIDKKDTQVCIRIEDEIEKRIFTPFEKNAEEWWYIGYIEGHKINNWNPWILSNILFTAAVFVNNIERLERMCDHMLLYTDNWVDTYKADGGCDEGPSYWGAAGASYYDFLDLLYKMSEGRINRFNEQIVYNMGDYIRKMHIYDKYFVNFADSGPIPGNLDTYLIYRFGKMTNNKKLMDFACMFNIPLRVSSNHPQRTLFNMMEKKDITQSNVYNPGKQEIMNDTQIYIFRNSTHFFAIKGGHNREAHNHNDVGHFVMYEHRMPVIIDAGSDTYSKKTFSDERYTLWYMQSSYHNLPDISRFSQLPGSDYRAKDVIFDDKGKSVSLQLKDTYPKEAGILSFIRKVEIKEEAVIIQDDISLEKEGYIEGHLMLLNEPLLNNNIVQISNTKIVIENAHKVEYEKIFILNTIGLNTDIPERGNMAQAWDTDYMYRIKAATTAKEASIKYTISRRD